MFDVSAEASTGGRFTRPAPHNLPTRTVARYLLALRDDTPDEVVMHAATTACDHLYERLWGVLQGNDSIEALNESADLILGALGELAHQGFSRARKVAQIVAGLDDARNRSASGLFDEIHDLDENLRCA